MDQSKIFEGDDPFLIVNRWMDEASRQELNDPNAIALATVDAAGMPNVRMVLLKEVEVGGKGGGCFVFYTNYGSSKAFEIALSKKAAFVLHWKSLRRQIRVRGTVSKEDGPKADAYFSSRSIQSRIGAWASRQSESLASRKNLLVKAAGLSLSLGVNPARPPFWGGFKIYPLEIEFWSDGAFRLHDRFLWKRKDLDQSWHISRLNP